MNTKQRVRSILQASVLGKEVTGVTAFELDQLNINEELEPTLPQNLRLGHLVEHIVGELIQSSKAYECRFHSLQIRSGIRTLGELDFILRDRNRKRFIHLEVAYKFYLFDPALSDDIVEGLIGPNRNDTLVQKLEKLKTKQFPLLYRTETNDLIGDLDPKRITQLLCFMCAVYLPYNQLELPVPSFAKAVRGFHLGFAEFLAQHEDGCQYFIPPKRMWGMSPDQAETWFFVDSVKQAIVDSLSEQRSVLCWQRCGLQFLEFFITWW